MSPKRVQISRQSCPCPVTAFVERYRNHVDEAILKEVVDLAGKLHGLRVCNVNATASGGGVAELLHRQVPIYRSLGIEADWRIIHGDKEFFTTTKGFHNALQGGEFRITATIAQEYLETNRTNAEDLTDDYDVYMIHDPQPAAIRHFAGKRNAKWIWRCHIDTSEPYREVWDFLRPYIEEYDVAIFTIEKFRPPDLELQDVRCIAPAIDPVSTKNMDLPESLPDEVIRDYGLSVDRPILLQVSRFDPWKDPVGVIRVYQLVKEKIPDVQLVMIGAMAGDDPQGWDILEQINARAIDDPDLYVFTNMTGLGNMEVNAFQRGCDVAIQKSIREGFGLVVSESLWKATPIVAGGVGGIPIQFPSGYERFLIHSVEECAQRVLELLQNPDGAKEFGEAGKKHVRENFLLPRLIRDELRLFAELVG